MQGTANIVVLAVWAWPPDKPKGPHNRMPPCNVARLEVGGSVELGSEHFQAPQCISGSLGKYCFCQVACRLRVFSQVGCSSSAVWGVINAFRFRHCPSRSCSCVHMASGAWPTSSVVPGSLVACGTLDCFSEESLNLAKSTYQRTLLARTR